MEPIREIAVRNLNSNIIIDRLPRKQTLSYKTFVLDELFNCFLWEYGLEKKVTLLLKTYYLSPCDENNLCINIDENYSIFTSKSANKIYVIKKIKRYIKEKHMSIGKNIGEFSQFIPEYAKKLIRFDTQTDLIINVSMNNTQITINVMNFNFVYMINTVKIIVSNICDLLLYHPKTSAYMYSYKDASRKFKYIPSKNYVDAFLTQLFTLIHKKYEQELSKVVIREKVSITNIDGNRVIRIDFFLYAD